jgi:L-ribulokinase
MTVFKRAALGLDFGTESVRALVVDTTNGDELAQAIVRYRHGVMSERLPHLEKRLPRDFALQSADDYRESMVQAIREVLTKVPAKCIAGIGVDFTACTILPILRDGTPLHRSGDFKDEPHAWVKLWKHHGAQEETDRINALANERAEPFLKYYADQINCEWMLPKCWEIARHAPHVYERADYFIDAGDWIVHELTGKLTRNACAAGYKGLWNAELGFPNRSFLKALDSVIEHLESKWITEIVAPGHKAGLVSRRFAEETGLIEGTPVSAATIDAHSGVPGCGVYREGPLTLVMGTSTCHMALSRELKFVKGCAGVVKDGIIPGFYGHESGQAAVGDMFGWFSRFTNRSFEELSLGAAALRPGEAGVLALDWWSGNRTPLMNSNLTGLIAGLSLETKPEHVYRALIEATAFGTRTIAEDFRRDGVPVTELVVCGGLTQDPLILQIYADVMQLPVKVAASKQAVALGAAMFGEMAASGRTTEEVVVTMSAPPESTFAPNPAHKEVYDGLFKLYRQAFDEFGRAKPEWMKSLKGLRTHHAVESERTILI